MADGIAQTNAIKKPQVWNSTSPALRGYCAKTIQSRDSGSGLLQAAYGFGLRSLTLTALNSASAAGLEETRGLF